jgi:hypothetical protein
MHTSFPGMHTTVLYSRIRLPPSGGFPDPVITVLCFRIRLSRSYVPGSGCHDMGVSRIRTSCFFVPGFRKVATVLLAWFDLIVQAVEIVLRNNTSYDFMFPVSIHVCTYMYMCVCVCGSVYVCVFVCMFLHTHKTKTRIHDVSCLTCESETNMRICIHTYIHTYIHT